MPRGPSHTTPTVQQGVPRHAVGHQAALVAEEPQWPVPAEENPPVAVDVVERDEEPGAGRVGQELGARAGGLVDPGGGGQFPSPGRRGSNPSRVARTKTSHTVPGQIGLSIWPVGLASQIALSTAMRHWTR